MARLRNPRGGGDRLRLESIEAATRLLAVLGEREALSIRAIAKEAGITPTSVYLHFRDKDEIVVTVLARLFAELAAVRDAAENVLPSAGPWERLLARSLAYVRYGVDDNPGHTRCFTRVAPCRASTRPTLRRSVSRCWIARSNS